MPVLSNAFVPLSGSDRTKKHGSVAVSASDPASEIDFTLKLRRKQPLPEFGSGIPQRLSADELAANYGASQDDIDAVTRTLADYNMRVLSTDISTGTVRAIGTVAHIQDAFQTKLFEFSSPEGPHRGRTGSLFVPANLNGIITGVFGLDDRRIARRQTATLTRETSPSNTGGLQFGAGLASLYNFPAGDGAGQTIGILEFGGGYFASDLTSFWRLDGNNPQQIPNIATISVDGAAVDAVDGAETEVMLDIEVLASAMPKAQFNVYFSNFDEQGWVDIIDRVIKDKPAVVSVSWGLAEDSPDWTSSALSAINDALQQAALLGINVLVASGDDGSDDQVGDGHAHVNFPASSPYVLAVGGTQFEVLKGQISNESVWKDGTGIRPNGGCSGGGVSVIFPRPSWQTVQIASVNPNAIDGRVVPDISALAGSPDYQIVADGNSEGVGGTSAATPLWAALIARISAKLATKEITLPFVAPLLYQPYGGSTVGASGTNDITTGDNITSQIGGYSAGPGFDAVTGWGSPNGTALLSAITSVLAAPASPHL